MEGEEEPTVSGELMTGFALLLPLFTNLSTDNKEGSPT